MSKVKKNYFFDFIYRVINIIIPVVTIPYISRTMGVNAIGKFSYFYSIALLFQFLSNLSIADYGKRLISYYQGDNKEISLSFFQVKFITIIQLFISLTIYIFYILNNTNFVMFVYFLPMIFSQLIDVSWVFAGVEDFRTIFVRNIIIKIVSMLIIFSLVKTPDDMPYYILSVVVLPILSSIFLYPKLYHVINFKFFKINYMIVNFKEHYISIFKLFIPTIAIQIYSTLDKLIIGIYDNTGFQNGLYEQAIKVPHLLFTVIVSLGVVVAPRIGYIYKNKNFEKVINYLYMCINCVCFVGIPMSFGLASIINNFAPWFFGEQFIGIEKLIFPLSFLIIIMGLSNIIASSFIIPIGKEKIYTLSTFSAACINFIFNMLLIPKFGAYGACIGTIIAEFVNTMIQLFYILRYVKIGKLFNDNCKYIIVSIIMFVVTLFLSNRISPTIIHTLLIIMIGFIIYVLILYFLKDKLLLYFLNYIIKYFVSLKKLLRNN